VFNLRIGRRSYYFLLPALGLGAWFLFCLPDPLFRDPTSTILGDSKGELLSARVAKDGQWRFPAPDSIPVKFEQALLLFEDEYFYSHPGVNPVSLLRAIRQNFSGGRTISGGSTLSMQTIRLARKGKSRNILVKCIEMIQAVRMELTYSKKEILKLYTAHAPFGGNVVGLDAASWRYFNRNACNLSWGETAALAVLPNAPALIYPGKNADRLKKKRDRLLDKLFLKGVIDKETCELSKAEPLPGKPFPIPKNAPHLLQRAAQEGYNGQRVHATLDGNLQVQLNKIVDDYHSVLSQNEIHNIAALVLDVRTGKVLAYTGNTNCPDEHSGKDVDIILSPRSTGSILKPFLYASMLQDGVLLPDALVPDIPTQIGGYAPQNFEETFDGAVPASEALARSLNVPAVRMLQDYGLELFYDRLEELHLPTISKPASHYGLSIIIGGAEATLWDLSCEYMKMAQTLHGFSKLKGAAYVKLQEANREKPVFDKGALWWTLEAMSTVTRPWQETGWEDFQSSRKIAWKTGTSIGHRDAWSIGITPDHVVGIWVGNADGEGRPGLTGVSVAAPIMFKVFKLLKGEGWFHMPQARLTNAMICVKSGFLAGEACDSTKVQQVPGRGKQTPTCPFHEIIHLDSLKQYRVTSDCYPVYEMIAAKWFVLPPVQEWYYRKKEPLYKSLPAFKPGCQPDVSRNMAVIYPRQQARIFIPLELDGRQGRAVFEIAHRLQDTEVYWHLDDTFAGTTRNEHKLEIITGPGWHRMTVVDARGETVTWRFEVLDK
jgi:penicillin-binding protein 1C